MKGLRMMEKTDVKSKHSFTEEKEIPQILKLVIFEIVGLVLGFAAAKVQLFDGLSPFAVAFVSALPARYSLAAVIGGSVACLSSASASNAVQSIAAMAAAAAINTTVSRFVSLRESRIVSPAIAAICCLASGITTMLAVGFSLNATLLFLCEAVLAGGVAYFIKRSMLIRPLPSGGFSLSTQETACVIITACVLLMSLSVFSFKGMIPARMFAVFLIFIFARFARETGGSIAGICAGVSIGLVTNNFALTSMLALGGLLAGIFAPLGRFGIVGAFISVCGVSALVSGESQAVAVLIEAGIAGTIFLAIPPNKIESLKKHFTKSHTPYPADNNKNSLIIRLNSTASAIGGVSTYIEKVSGGLKRMTMPESTTVFVRVREEVCKSCGLYAHCWTACEQETQEAFDAIADITKSDECISPDMIGEPLLSRCIRIQEICSSFNKHYLNMVAKRGTTQRVGQIREVVSDQFEGIADMLKGIADDLNQTGNYEPELARLAAEVCESFDIKVFAVSCFTNHYGRMSIHLQTSPLNSLVNKTQLTRELSKVCDRDFDLPCISENSDYAFSTFSQRSSIKVKLGATQIPSEGNEYCGDYFECFDDGNGHEIMILSDGMGTGARAAVDAALATEIFSSLVKSGIDFGCALRLTNSALLVKGIDESLSTLDVVSIDLFSGKAEFLKAGGATSFVRKKNKVAALALSSLPAGILREISFEKAYANLEQGDTVVMVSDGIIGSDGAWILAELKAWKGESAQDLAERIAELARHHKGKGREDDMTVICAIID